MTLGDDAEMLGAGALEWLLGKATAADTGLWWPGAPGSDQPDTTFYHGTAGVVPALLEGWRHFDDDRYADAALRGARWLTTRLTEPEHYSLYVGVMGTAVALGAVDDVLGDDASGKAVTRVLDLVRQRFDGTSWDKWFELLLGNAGIGMAALQLGDLDLAVLAVEPYLSAAMPTPHGLAWYGTNDGSAKHLMHHISHGTLGVSWALTAVGHAVGRSDLWEAGLAGVNDVVARNEAGDDEFLVPHSDPQHAPERTARYNYGWCHGPAGDAHVFRTLSHITGDRKWMTLVDRCWNTITGSGLPQRLRPGFWDNNARCCGTAGILALAGDRIVERGDSLDFANVLVTDLAGRAITDDNGTRWSNHDHSADEPDLEPRIGWGHGNAGIIPELLRYTRITRGQKDSYAVVLPDRPTTDTATPKPPSR